MLLLVVLSVAVATRKGPPPRCASQPPLSSPLLSARDDDDAPPATINNKQTNKQTPQAYPYGRIGCDLEVGSWVHSSARIVLRAHSAEAAAGVAVTDGRRAVHVEYTFAPGG